MALYAIGMSYEAISEHLSEMYGLEISSAKISLITDKLLPLITEWRNRSLESVYPIVFLDAMHFKVRVDGKVISRAFYTVLAVNSEGKKDILGLYLSEAEGARFWLGVLNDLKARGVEDILIASIDGLKGFPDAITKWTGRLDLLVNNASIFMRDDSVTDHAQNWELLFTTNVKAPYLLSLAAQPLLAQYEGSIINISDTHAERALKEYSVYCQTKAALEMQTKSLAREFAPKIRVNAVAPGAIAWPEQANSLTPEMQEKIIAKTPLKQHGNPEYIAQAVLFFAENPFITGQILKVDGGRSIN